MLSWAIVIGVGVLAAYLLYRSVRGPLRGESACAGCPKAAEGCRPGGGDDDLTPFPSPCERGVNGNAAGRVG